MQGVSINIFIKTGNKKKEKLGEVFHNDLYGNRDLKYKLLSENSLFSFKWEKLNFKQPNFFFVKKNFDKELEYEKGFSLFNLMKNFNPGVESGRDDFFIDFNSQILERKIKNSFENKNSLDIKLKYGIKNSESFKFENNFQLASFNKANIQKISYRPFDIRYSYYDLTLQRRPSNETFKHILKGNIGLIIKRGFTEYNSAPIFITNNLSDRRGWTRSGMQGAESISPLYIYPETTTQKSLLEVTVRIPNLNMEIVNEISLKLGIPFVAEKNTSTALSVTEFAPIDILDYIYAVLHSPSYREKYKEFLKIDFPRVPFPDAVGISRDLSIHEIKNKFWKLVKLGSELRQIHLLESEVVEKRITQFDIDGTNVVSKPRFVKIDSSIAPLPKFETLAKVKEQTLPKVERETLSNVTELGKVYINETQFFANVPEVAWNFYIGGYQPAQKWLKDRKERELTTEDIFHYQKIIVALTETDRIMKEIDLIEV